MILFPLLGCAGSPTSPPPAEPAPAAILEGMDDRRPVPLHPQMALHQKEQMRGHLIVVQEVIAGLAAEDWAAIEAAAARMGTSPEMSQRCERMGAAAEGFTDEALAFHQRADAITAAARAHDGAAVLRATADTLEACTSCHATWRQQIVSDAEYDALTAD